MIADRLRAWMTHADQIGASDLHILAGHPPVLRLHGDLQEFPEPALSDDDADELVRSLCQPTTLTRLETQTDVDFSIDLELGGRSVRFRANLFRAGGQLGACLRVIPGPIPGFMRSGKS